MSKRGGLRVAIKVKVSNPSFNGFRGGVRFYNGEATFEDEAKGRKLAEALGYEVIELDTPKKTTKKATSTKKTTRKTTSKKTEEGVK